jgi:hypothetical protein
MMGGPDVYSRKETVREIRFENRFIANAGPLHTLPRKGRDSAKRGFVEKSH